MEHYEVLKASCSSTQSDIDEAQAKVRDAALARKKMEAARQFERILLQIVRTRIAGLEPWRKELMMGRTHQEMVEMLWAQHGGPYLHRNGISAVLHEVECEVEIWGWSMVWS